MSIPAATDLWSYDIFTGTQGRQRIRNLDSGDETTGANTRDIGTCDQFRINARAATSYPNYGDFEISDVAILGGVATADQLTDSIDWAERRAG